MLTIIAGVIAVVAIGAIVAITMSSGSSSGSAHGDRGDAMFNNNGQNVTEGKKYTVGLNENLGLKVSS
jgi:hypothetical protein